MMKKVFLYLLAGSMIITSCKKDEETPEVPTVPAVPADTEKPVVAITAPASTIVEQGGTMEVTVSITDNTALATYAYAAAPDVSVKGGTTITGTSQEVKIMVKPAADATVGEHVLTVTATDAAGNASAPVTLKYTVKLPKDTELPKLVGIKVMKPTSGDLESGTSSINEVEFHFTDNRTVASVVISLYNTETAINKEVWSQTAAAADLNKAEFKVTYKPSISSFDVTGTGDACEFRYTVKDADGNELKGVKAVKVI